MGAKGQLNGHGDLPFNVFFLFNAFFEEKFGG